jgi:demethylmenaquinone methyltransferase/2-methoxy-6-polyprenyl-1,4-benzoquinol methylase
MAAAGNTPPESLPPLPPLPAYYDGDAGRRRFLDDLFDRNAPHYDRIVAVMSLGAGNRYRQWRLRRAGLRPDMTVLDVAVGTGAVARAALAILGASGRVVGVDPSPGMLTESRKIGGITVARGIAEQLPFRDRTFDFVTMGYALRHVADLRATFAEYHRVLRPGGRLVILDFARPTSPAGLDLARLYARAIVPRLARLVAGSEAAGVLMRYCWASVEHCVPPETIQAAIAAVGFETRRPGRWLGVLSEYVGIKP